MLHKALPRVTGRIEEAEVERRDHFAGRRKFGESREVDLRRERELESVAKEEGMFHRSTRESTVIESECSALLCE